MFVQDQFHKSVGSIVDPSGPSTTSTNFALSAIPLERLCVGLLDGISPAFL